MFDVSPTAGMVPTGKTPRDTVVAICQAHGVSVDLVRGPFRTAYLVRIRRQIAHALRDLGCSTAQTGRLLGGRDHTTVMSYLRPEMRAVKYSRTKCGL